jgi:hypothetical protein
MSDSFIANNTSYKIQSGGAITVTGSPRTFSTTSSECADLIVYQNEISITINSTAFVSSASLRKFKIAPLSSVTVPSGTGATYVIFRNTP